jgi:hypothetical protein
VLKQVVAEVAPFLASLYNRSLSTGVFPERYKTAYITPIVKKPGLDPADVRSYRPISNLSVASKLLERLVARQVIDYIQLNYLLPDQQSAYRPNFSTETAILRVLSDVFRPLTKATLQFLHFWIYQRRLTRLTTAFY